MDFIVKIPLQEGFGGKPRSGLNHRSEVFSLEMQSSRSGKGRKEVTQVGPQDERALSTLAGFQISFADGLVDFSPADAGHRAGFRNRKTFALNRITNVHSGASMFIRDLANDGDCARSGFGFAGFIISLLWRFCDPTSAVDGFSQGTCRMSSAPELWVEALLQLFNKEHEVGSFPAVVHSGIFASRCGYLIAL
jgi:hypothetical protein